MRTHLMGARSLQAGSVSEAGSATEEVGSLRSQRWFCLACGERRGRRLC